ncbi:hypothetical protein [Vibrio alginolyticus]
MKKWKKTLLASSGILLSSMAFAGNEQSQKTVSFQSLQALKVALKT